MFLVRDVTCIVPGTRDVGRHFEHDGGLCDWFDYDVVVSVEGGVSTTPSSSSFRHEGAINMMQCFRNVGGCDVVCENCWKHWNSACQGRHVAKPVQDHQHSLTYTTQAHCDQYSLI
jgi:hypothetical protein